MDRIITKQMDNLKDLSSGILQNIFQEIVISCSHDHIFMSGGRIFR